MRNDGVKSETVVAAAQWHADQSFLSRPARGSLLRCVLAPAVGGDTMFANMYLAFDLLSDGLKRMLEGQRARSEEHTSELPSLMRISYAVFCLKTKITHETSANTIEVNTE